MSDAQYEYKTMKLPSGNLHGGLRRKRERILNKLGAEGWELVDSTPPPFTLLGSARNDSATFRRKR